MPKHSPTPWHVDRQENWNSVLAIESGLEAGCGEATGHWAIFDANGDIVALEGEQDELPALKHIVACVNLHDELVAKLGALHSLVVATVEAMEEIELPCAKFPNDDLRELLGSTYALLAKAKGDVIDKSVEGKITDAFEREFWK